VREQFDRLFQTHYEPILRYAARRVGTESAHDVANETFLVAWRRQDKVPSAAEEELPWLYGVARQIIANEERSRRRRDRLGARLRAVRQPDQCAPQPETGSVLSAMNRLSPGDREVLRLVAWEGLDNRAAAIVVGCSARTFSVRLHRARKRLAAELSSTEPERSLPCVTTSMS